MSKTPRCRRDERPEPAVCHIDYINYESAEAQAILRSLRDVKEGRTVPRFRRRK